MPVSPCIQEGCQRAKLEADLAAAQQKNDDLNTAFQITFDRGMEMAKELAASQAELQRMTIKWAPVAIERDEARAASAALISQRDEALISESRAVAEAAALKAELEKLKAEGAGNVNG